MRVKKGQVLMKEVIFKVRSNIEIADGIYEMILGCEKGQHGISSPGQFVNIKLAGFFLRRPISVCSWEEDSVTLIYKIVGKGTEELATYGEGKELNVLTPLGNGFDTARAKQIDKDGVNECTQAALIGGGAGVPPLYGLCRQLIAEGIIPCVILGFNSASESFYIEKFRELGAEVQIATADGSLGAKGLVTDVLGNVSCGYFYACGPEPMLRAIDEALCESVDGQMSFEERMGCGFGACMGCSCKTKYGYKRICREGPVLKRGEIIW